MTLDLVGEEAHLHLGLDAESGVVLAEPTVHEAVRLVPVLVLDEQGLAALLQRPRARHARQAALVFRRAAQNLRNQHPVRSAVGTRRRHVLRTSRRKRKQEIGETWNRCLLTLTSNGLLGLAMAFELADTLLTRSSRFFWKGDFFFGCWTLLVFLFFSVFAMTACSLVKSLRKSPSKYSGSSAGAVQRVNTCTAAKITNAACYLVALVNDNTKMNRCRLEVR